MSKKINIAIDGPAGSGKSTVAKLVANTLGYLYIDTGAMYRALTLKAIRGSINLSDPLVVTDFTANTIVKLRIGDDQSVKVLLDNEDVTEEIRSPYISQNVSHIAKIPDIRRYLVKIQQSMAEQGGIVMEGRDIGTVVLPEAQIKIFLTASPEERAKRRREELAAKGYQIALKQMLREIEERDSLDSSRETDPLIPAADAKVIDCSANTAAEVAQIIIRLVEAAS